MKVSDLEIEELFVLLFGWSWIGCGERVVEREVRVRVYSERGKRVVV